MKVRGAGAQGRDPRGNPEVGTVWGQKPEAGRAAQAGLGGPEAE